MANCPCPKCNSCNTVELCRKIKTKKVVITTRECLDCKELFKEK